MGSLTFIVSTANAPNKDSAKINSSSTFAFGIQTLNFRVSSRPRFPINGHFLCLSTPKPRSHSNPQIDGEEDDPEEYVQNLRVPDHWLNPSKPLEHHCWNQNG